MIVTMLSGGLGNQMFQYAAARRLAVRHGTEVRVDTRLYDDAGRDRRPAGLEAFSRRVRLFDLRTVARRATDADVVPRLDRYLGLTAAHRAARAVRAVTGGRLFRQAATHVRERSAGFDPAVLGLPDGVYLQGFWQSWRYFADVADTIRGEFRAADGWVPSEVEYKVGRARASGGGPVVSLHVRRGDLAHAAEVLGDAALVYGPPVGLDYLRAAVARFEPSAQFLVFSDTAADVDWCRHHLPAAGLAPGRLHFATGDRPDVVDLASMSACDHHVIANSTFSWWAAWLNATPGRRVVAPRRWAADQLKSDDLIPPGWEQV